MPREQQQQLAAEMAQAWPVTPRYRVTQPGQPDAQAIWWRLVQAYMARRQVGE